MGTEHPTKTFGLQSLGDALKYIEEAMTIVEQDDPDRQPEINQQILKYIQT
ncbi:hypothetical protein CBL_09365 [Carabus blaptoides fortunei]